jgi:hypothetical protein
MPHRLNKKLTTQRKGVVRILLSIQVPILYRAINVIQANGLNCKNYFMAFFILMHGFKANRSWLYKSRFGLIRFVRFVARYRGHYPLNRIF